MTCQRDICAGKAFRMGRRKGKNIPRHLWWVGFPNGDEEK